MDSALGASCRTVEPPGAIPTRTAGSPTNDSNRSLDDYMIPLLIDCFHEAAAKAQAPYGSDDTGNYYPASDRLLQPRLGDPEEERGDIPICDDVSRLALDEHDVLGEISVSVKDSTEIENVPYWEIFDSKKESTFLPRMARQSWGEGEHEDDDKSVDGYIEEEPAPSASGCLPPWDLRPSLPRFTWSAASMEWPSFCVTRKMRKDPEPLTPILSRTSSGLLKRPISEAINTEPEKSDTDAKSKKRAKAKDQIESHPQPEEGVSTDPKAKTPLVGEHRLKISFISLGTVGDIPQHFGKKRSRIPDGLIGTHELYNQKWRFEVHHRKTAGSDVTTINWRVINLTSGTLVERTETTHEAFIREYKGQTICNQILRDALEVRTKELEAAASKERSPRSSAGIQTSLRALRPRKCIMGLLFFGLLHQCVQDNLKA